MVFVLVRLCYYTYLEATEKNYKSILKLIEELIKQVDRVFSKDGPHSRVPCRHVLEAARSDLPLPFELTDLLIHDQNNFITTPFNR